MRTGLILIGVLHLGGWVSLPEGLALGGVVLGALGVWVGSQISAGGLLESRPRSLRGLTRSFRWWTW